MSFVKDDFVFIYLNHKKKVSKSKGVICIGYIFHNNYLMYNMCYCSPKDNFEKKIAHKKIVGLFESRDQNICIDKEFVKRLSYNEIVEIILDDLIKHDFPENMPGWAKKIISKL